MIDPDGNIVLEPIYDEMYVYDDWLKLISKEAERMVLPDVLP